MGRLVVALDAGVDVNPEDLAATWDSDEAARMVGVAAVEASGRGDFLPGVLELVVIPLAVNLASSAACTIVSRLVARLRPAEPDRPELELVQFTDETGDQIIVVRLRGTRP